MNRFALIVVVMSFWAGQAIGAEVAKTSVSRGAYLVRAAGCIGCHTDVKGGGIPLAGGRGLETPFGIFYSPNITPHPVRGIGAWSDQSFLDALGHGRRPDGSNYFPVFPYPSYTKMRAEDALAIKAYLFAQKPVDLLNKAHDVPLPFIWRWTISLWKWLFFKPGVWQDQADQDPAWNRGGYLVHGLGHCGECHTPRNFMGAMDEGRFLAGTPDGPEGERSPNITPDAETGIGSWNDEDIVLLLREGTKPDYDDVQGSMAETIREGLSHLTDDDLAAIARYIRAVPAIENRVVSKAK